MSIRLRLTIYWAVVTAAILLAVGLLILVAFSRELSGILDKALLEEADTSAAALSQSSSEEAIAILRHLAAERDLGPGHRVRLTVGDTVAFDEGDPKTELPVGAPTRQTAIVDGKHHGNRFAVVSVRFHGQRALLWDGVDASPIRHTIARLRRRLLMVLPLILVLCVAGGYLLSALALNPVNAVATALARIGPRDLKQRLPTPKVHDEARRLVEEINELFARLERASASQRRFISEAAHELRTPLTVLRSGLEVTLQRARSTEESRVAMEDALAEVERLCATAEDLLALARLEAEPILNHDLVDMREVVASSTDTIKALAEAKHQTLVIEANTSLIVRGNGNDLRRVSLNLLDNAIKFSPERGRIAIAAVRQEHYAVLSVSDDGPGVEPQELSRVFDPFYRSRHSNGAGSGLGLALCREIVRVHGGDIRAANREGGGCEIQIRLPLVTD
jgi:signal transduction histidine kinase